VAVIIQTVDGVVANRFNIDKNGLRFGRTSDNQVQIDDIAVSNNHAEITLEINEEGKDIFILRDMGSTNGTFINEQIIIDRLQLYHGDSIRVGWNYFTFIDESESKLEKTSEIKKSWIPGVFFTKDK